MGTRRDLPRLNASLSLRAARTHLDSQRAAHKYFLRLRAAGSVKRAHGRPVRLRLAPRLRPGDSTQTLRIPSRDGHPALPVRLVTGPPGSCPALSTLPPCEGAAGLSPAREAPCWAHSPNPTLFRSSSGDEPCSPGQWDTTSRATPHPRG